MISSHYDTVALSPGVYDDTTGVAVVLELLKVLTQNAAWVF
jgi:Zn-dependent M28 family amino/carboxypeptidase